MKTVRQAWGRFTINWNQLELVGVHWKRFAGVAQR